MSADAAPFMDSNDSKAAAAALGPTEDAVLRSRDRGYVSTSDRQPVLTAAHLVAWGSLNFALASPMGVEGFCWICQLLSLGATPASSTAAPLATFLIATTITSWGSFLFFCGFALPLEWRYELQPEGRCQGKRGREDVRVDSLLSLAKKVAAPDSLLSFAKHARVLFLSRYDVQLAAINLTLSAAATVAIGIHHASRDTARRSTLIYLESPQTWSEMAYVLASTIGFFFWIDCWAYVSHRLLHLPLLYRTVHKTHHMWKQPTAFVALGLHPVEFLIFFGGVYAAFWLAPLHISAIAVNLLYVHYHNAVDHSGLYLESHLPWQPTSLYHDDHHRLFHVNYGQSLTIWDRLGGTFYQPNKAYAEHIFSH